MGFQFVHIQGYSRKSDKSGCSTAFVFDEASRKPGACEHVEKPVPPETIYGEGVDGVRGLHDTQASEAITTTKAGLSRKIRSDQQTLLTVIASHPYSPGEVAADPIKRAEVLAWQDRTVGWLKETWGDRLTGVIRHNDEGHVHLHAYLLPDDLDMRASKMHPGAVAKEPARAAALAEGLDQKAANKIGDAAYKRAMRELQDSYFNQVGIPSGLARLGPGRRRLTRDAWRAEQVQAVAVRVALSAAEVATTAATATTSASIEIRQAAEALAADLVTWGQAFVASARTAAAEAKAAADRAELARVSAQAAAAKVVRQAAANLAQAKREARQTVQGAQRQVARLRTWAERIGSLWVGLSGVQKRIELRADARVEVVRAGAAAAVKAVKVEILADLGGELAAARLAIAEAVRRQEAAERMSAEAKKNQSLAEDFAMRERTGRLSAEGERESFRGRWADADNQLQAMIRTRSV